MIILTTGATRIGSRLLRPEDGPFETDPKKEARLVRAGVARYCNMKPVIIAPAVQEEPKPGIDPSECTAPAESLGETAYTEDGLMLKTNKELEAIITELGLELPKKANKAALVKLIMDYYSIDGENPPELSAEAPEG